MLSKLRIKNYALIDSLAIDFDSQLNIITGETGAGKSIIMGALGLILGNRADSKQFFDAQRKCVVEAELLIANYQLQDIFEQLNLDYEETSIIRRELTPEGKSRAFVNDTPVTLQVLRLLAGRLIDVHSQHATLQINEASFQLFVLDTIAKNSELLNTYRETYGKFAAAKVELAQLQQALSNAQSERDYQQFVFDELDQAALMPAEQDQLESEQSQLEHAEEIKRHLHSAVQIFDTGQYPVLEALKQAVTELQQAGKYLPSIGSLIERCESSLIELKDIAEEVDQLGAGLSIDQERLLEIQDRLSILYGLQTKHRVNTVTELIVLREELMKKIAGSDTLQEQIKNKEGELSKLNRELTALALSLRKRRSGVISRIEQETASIFERVGMPRARLAIAMAPTAEFKEHGQDEVSFLFTANKGQALKPIHKVASGGELSRVMLAIKSIVAKESALPTIVFDEIDTGISGEVALRMGELLEALSNSMQVISITHLPQIASQGNAHYKVYKIEEENRTRSNITRLDNQERVMEIAEMLSGARPTETAIDHAQKMLSS